ERYPSGTADPFEQSRRFATFARDKLNELGPVAIAKAWLYGAAINIAAPAVTLSPLVSHLPRTGFYATAGTSMLNKIVNFLFRSDNAIYAWLLLFGIAGVVVIRLVQFAGLFALAEDADDRMFFLLFVAWILFVLLVSGPVASPKYRL